MAVRLEKLTDANFVSSVELSDSFEMVDGKGNKAQYSIRLETWQVPGSAKGQTEVRIVIRDIHTGQWHGATNFKQNIMLDITALLSGNHSNKRAGKK